MQDQGPVKHSAPIPPEEASLNKTASSKKGTNERKCIMTGQVTAPMELIRFVLDPSGVVTADLAGKLPGRGAWVTADPKLIAKAAKSGVFKRAFRGSCQADEDLAAIVFTGLKKRALKAIGLARRAGGAAAGFDQAKALLKEKKAGLLLTAHDAAADGAQKLARLARDIAVVRNFDVAELSAALGSSGVRHVAIADRLETIGLRQDILKFAAFAVSETKQTSDAQTPQ